MPSDSPAAMPKITLVLVLTALLSALTVLQGAIGALHFATPWDILAPALLTAGCSFLGTITGKNQAADLVAGLRTQVDLLEKENIILRQQTQGTASPVLPGTATAARPDAPAEPLPPPRPNLRR